MSRPRKMLNVRSHLEFEVWFINVLLEDKEKGKLELAPFYEGALKELRFFAEAILRTHAKKGTRKDIYVEKKGDTR